MYGDDDDYEVGFGKPPKSRQFKPGQSGNPKGRPKGRLNTATILRNACLEKVSVKTPQGTKMISKHQAAVTQLVNKAAAGEIKFVKELRVWLVAHPEIPASFLNCPPIHVHFVEPPIYPEMSEILAAEEDEE